MFSVWSIAYICQLGGISWRVINFCFVTDFPNCLEGFYQWPKKKCLERFCSDSSSDCGSSSGSVRASRGSWGSWSSTSSSDGDKKPIIPSRHFLPSSKCCKSVCILHFLRHQSLKIAKEEEAAITQLLQNYFQWSVF